MAEAIKVGDRVGFKRAWSDLVICGTLVKLGTYTAEVLNEWGTHSLVSPDKLTKLDDTPTDTAIVAAFQARELAEEVRERAITSLRWACDGEDWLACAAQANALGDLGGAELW